MIENLDEEVIEYMYDVASEKLGMKKFDDEDYFKDYDELCKVTKIVLERLMGDTAKEQIAILYGGGTLTEEDFTDALMNKIEKLELLMEAISYD